MTVAMIFCAFYLLFAILITGGAFCFVFWIIAKAMEWTFKKIFLGN